MFDVRDVDLEALAEAAPGPTLAALLAGIDTTRLNGHDRVVVMQAWERLTSWSSGRMYAVMAEVARSPMCAPDSAPALNDHVDEFAAAEIGAALTLSPGVADRELSFAYHVAERLHGTRAALDAGRLTLDRAQEIASETAFLSDALAGAVESATLEQAPTLTRQQLRRTLRATVLALDPDGAEERRQWAQQDRRVRFAADHESTGTVCGSNLPVAEVAAARAFVRSQATMLRREGDARTLGQLEADVFLDLLQGRQLGGHGAVPKVELVAPLQTWLDLADQVAVASPSSRRPAMGRDSRQGEQGGRGRDRGGDGGGRRHPHREPGELVGFGPVSAEVLAEIARAAALGFDYCHTVTVDGTVVHHRRTAYRPTRADREFTQARDRTCVQPGCARSAAACDVDHTMEHRLGGPTCRCNLATLCRRHHRAKHQGGWWWTQQAAGAYTAQSPLGHTYHVRPEPPPGARPPNGPSPAGTLPGRTRRHPGADEGSGTVVARLLALSPEDVRGPLTQAEAGTPF